MKTLYSVPLLLSLTATVSFAEPVLNVTGKTGHVHLPSAYMDDAGLIGFNYAFGTDLEGQYFGFQAADDLAIGVNLLSEDAYGSENTFDLKYQLLDEGEYWPALALGFDDFLGNGARSAEYLVASKSFGGLEASLGLGWGALAASDALFSSGVRPAVDSHTLSVDHMFKGDASLFAGLNYQTGWNGLALSADYTGELGNEYSLGISSRPSERVSFKAYYDANGAYGVALNLAGNPNRAVTPQDLGRPPLAVVPRAKLGTDMSPAWFSDPAMGKATGAGFAQIVENEGGELVASTATASRISLEVKPVSTLITPKVIGRIARSLAMNAPGSVEVFDIAIVNNAGVVTSKVSINRSQYEASLEQSERNAISWQSVDISGAVPLSGDYVYRADPPKRFDWSAGVDPQLDLFNGGGIRFVPYANANFRLLDGLTLNARATAEIYDVPTSLTPADALELVRSDAALYRQDRVSLDRLTLDYLFKMGGDLYGRASLGLIERQYAGLSTEFIYAPAAQPFALGLDMAQVQKRDPENPFGVLDKDATTGFATLYWNPEFYGLETSVAYGQFLGGDWGSEIHLAKQFGNGWRVEGGLVVPETFFDTSDTRELQPSIKVTLPLQWSLPQPSRSRMNIGIGGSGSDVGARLRVSNPIYPTIRDYDAQSYELRWGAFWQ